MRWENRDLRFFAFPRLSHDRLAMIRAADNKRIALYERRRGELFTVSQKTGNAIDQAHGSRNERLIDEVNPQGRYGHRYAGIRLVNSLASPIA